MNLLGSLVGSSCALLALGACTHMPNLPLVGGTPEAVSAASPRERVRAAISLLGAGEERSARRELRAALDAEPSHVTARRLLEQIEGDPRRILGANARPYVVQPGETMAQIAERFLGDGLMFYALARYNNISAPNTLAAGQTLMVPRRAGAPAIETAHVVSATPQTPAVSARRGVDPARANQLRLRALQLLNAGQVDDAVALLLQARALDAGNAAIQRDLDRAMRLQASLRSDNG